MSQFDSLAGLDSMILLVRSHPTPTLSTSVTLDGESYVFVPKRGKKFAATRTPLANKSNTINSPALNTGPFNKPDVSFSIYSDNINESIDSVQASRQSTVPKPHSFRPLPPMVASSPLKTSFLDLSIPANSPIPESQFEASLSVLPSPQNSPSRSRAEDVLAGTTSSGRSRKSHNEKFLVPAVQHPNSPYVPWTPPVRRRIIPYSAASASVVSDYSRPFSRSGARAPEPTATPEPKNKGWKLVKQTISKRVGRMVNRVGRLRSPSAMQRPATYLPAITSRAAHAKSISEDVNFSSAHHPTPQASTHYLISPSLASLASSDSTTLERWLEARQEEEDPQPESTMSIADYEARGSWLNLADKKTGGNWSCRVPGCEVHAQQEVSSEGQVTTLDFSPMAESIDEHSSATPSTSPQVRPASDMASTTPVLASVKKGATPRFSPHRRERSMPGGWTF
ncbi:hypothetical protein FIBSPDRAFT_925305 [Athelia psychrophila]|uniref:Ig-like domain-containing protein n=1 Tax=Athelia psychrophila TaxID=1759441 RepID=A0A166V5X6_9AGAM|nr:hypothetical protein FIBSPDRAFT_925305 [Fibularhizoctonia sp. CBS 109695]